MDGKGAGAFIFGAGTLGLLEGCELALTPFPPLFAPPPPLCRRRVMDGKGAGAFIYGVGTLGRLESCELACNERAGLWVGDGAEPSLLSCTCVWEGAERRKREGKREKRGERERGRGDGPPPPSSPASAFGRGQREGKGEGKREKGKVGGRRAGLWGNATGAGLSLLPLLSPPFPLLLSPPSPLPSPTPPRLHTGLAEGVVVSDAGSKARLERCEVAGNADGGVWAQKEGNPVLIWCTIRDHAAGRAAGVVVASSARGKGVIGAGNVFLRNVKADVVRD